MTPIPIFGFNAVATWPEKFPSEGGECGSLAVRVTKAADESVLTCESAWEPSPEELRILAAGGHIVLRVFGWQVPVALEVAPADPRLRLAPASPDAGTGPGDPRA